MLQSHLIYRVIIWLKSQSLTEKNVGWIILPGQKVLDHNYDSNETPCLAVQSELMV